MCFYVLVAHLDRVRPSEGRGSAFESHRGRQSIKKRQIICLFLIPIHFELELYKHALLILDLRHINL